MVRWSQAKRNAAAAGEVLADAVRDGALGAPSDHVTLVSPPQP